MLFLRYTFTTGRAHYDQLILKFIVALIACGSFVLFFCLFCYTVLSINSSFAHIPLGKRDLIALILLSSCCHATVSVPCLFLTVWLLGLQYVIVVFSGLLVLRMRTASPSTRFYTSHIVNRLDFKLKKDGSYITFKSETALTNIFYAKK